MGFRACAAFMCGNDYFWLTKVVPTKYIEEID